MTVYATMHPPSQLLQAASMGDSGTGPLVASGALLVLVAKSEAKESIAVCVCVGGWVGGWRYAMTLSEPFQALLLYFIGLRAYGKIVKADVSEDHA